MAWERDLDAKEASRKIPVNECGRISNNELEGYEGVVISGGSDHPGSETLYTFAIFKGTVLCKLILNL